jgi:hypothetical protein
MLRGKKKSRVRADVEREERKKGDEKRRKIQRRWL